MTKKGKGSNLIKVLILFLGASLFRNLLSINERGVKVNYIYKKKEKKNGNCIISIRDKWENALIEFEQKNNQIEIMINYRNEKTTKFSLPIETFEKVYEDIKTGRRES